MDTKWKRFKGLTGFICFFTGWTLLLAGTLSLLSGYAEWRYNPARINELVNGDYQNTRDFKSYISSKLSTALDMAAGKMIGSSFRDEYGYYYDGYYDDYYGYADDYDYQQELILEAVWESNVIEGNQTQSGEDWYEEEEQKITPEQNKKIAERIHAKMEPNKNLLYVISYEGKVLYSNTEGISLDGSAGTIPERYNFLLHFDGSKVKISKDGQEIDVYGDGYYREDSDWYVPGYENFITDEEMEKAEIYMAVVREPERYIYGKSGQPGFRQAEDELYWIQKNLEEDRPMFARDIFFWVAGVLLLIVSHFRKKDRVRFEETIVRFMSSIWLEIKIVLGTGIVVLLAVWGIADGYYYGLAEYLTTFYQETAVSMSAIYEGNSFYMGAELLQEVLALLLGETKVLIGLFWLIYLGALDIRKNPGVWKQSLTAKVMTLLSARELRQPFAKKLVHRCIPIAAASAVLCAAALAAAVSGDNMGLLLLVSVLVILVLGIQGFYLSHTKKLAVDVDLLTQRIAAIHGGQYEGNGEVSASADLAKTFDELEDIRQGMSKAIDEQMKSQRMKVELIANVSHDIKTPLTSIISYVEFLKQEEGLPEHVKDYVRILDEKSQRLKTMIQDVFAVSKAASGQLTVNMELLDFGKLLRQTLADMDEQIRSSSVTVKAELPEEPVIIEADGQKMYRVFQNLIQNALKYSLEGSRIYITLGAEGELAVASIKNTSRFEIAQDKDFTERFVRGDESRTDGGSGLGLSIARNFTEACGGEFKLETIADLFLVTISFQTLSAD